MNKRVHPLEFCQTRSGSYNIDYCTCKRVIASNDASSSGIYIDLNMSKLEGEEEVMIVETQSATSVDS